MSSYWRRQLLRAAYGEHVVDWRRWHWAERARLRLQSPFYEDLEALVSRITPSEVPFREVMLRDGQEVVDERLTSRPQEKEG